MYFVFKNLHFNNEKKKKKTFISMSKTCFVSWENEHFFKNKKHIFFIWLIEKKKKKKEEEGNYQRKNPVVCP